MVESWLSNLTNKRLVRGSFSSVPALKRAIEEFVAAYNSKAKPFVWTKDADEVPAKSSHNTTSVSYRALATS